MLTYAEARELLGTRSKRRLRDAATHLVRLDARTIGITYGYVTSTIITYSVNGNTTLHWPGINRPPSVRARFSRYGPAHVSLRDGEWFIKDQVWFDGIKLSAQGVVLNPKRVASAILAKCADSKLRIRHANAKLRQYVTSYCTECVSLGDWPKASACNPSWAILNNDVSVDLVTYALHHHAERDLAELVLKTDLAKGKTRRLRKLLLAILGRYRCYLR